MHLVFLIYAQIHTSNLEHIDDTAKIERPCLTYDLNCIRVFFEKHAHCKKTFGPIPDPINRPEVTLELPRDNFTLVAPNLQISGLNNARMEEFYINRDTDNLVIAVDFRDFTQQSNNIYFKYYRRAKEPVVTVTPAVLNYTSQVVTAVIPKINDLQLHLAEVHTYSNDPTGEFLIGPAAVESTDPQPLASLTALFQDVPTANQEITLLNPQYFIGTYIQYNICDFGLLLT
ncbi:fibroin p25 domain-containing protein [Phthorimaea operculella]|nr:fibroin p25 domain-containing protein [Phthorimaea operculella]